MRTKKILLGSTYDGKGTNQGEMKEAATKKKEKADKEIFSLNEILNFIFAFYCQTAQSHRVLQQGNIWE